MNAVLAVDVGGTKFAAAVVDPAGAILIRATAATPSSPDSAVVSSALVRLVQEIAATFTAADGAGGDRIDGVGIGSAGPIDLTTGTVSPVNIPAWRGFDIVAAVTAAVPGRPVVLAGDGHCMALGEYWRGGFGAGDIGSASLLGVVVSTGVGGGLIIDGRIYYGPTGNAGHIGHTVVALDGEACPCGGRGCVELFASGPAMVRWAGANGWSPGSDSRRPRDARALARDAASGHPVARAAFERAAQALATAIVSAAALVDLDDVVIGGGVAGAGDVLFAPLRAAIAARAGLGFVRRLRVHGSALGADAGLLGAAALALDAAGSSSPSLQPR